MKLVIDIPSGFYKNIERIKKGFYGSIASQNIFNAVANGTPLPKEHGRLKDADKLYNIFNELCDEYNIDNMSFISEMNMNFDLAQTIIEANKGE